MPGTASSPGGRLIKCKINFLLSQILQSTWGQKTKQNKTKKTHKMSDSSTCKRMRVSILGRVVRRGFLEEKRFEQGAA